MCGIEAGVPDLSAAQRQLVEAWTSAGIDLSWARSRADLMAAVEYCIAHAPEAQLQRVMGEMRRRRPWLMACMEAEDRVLNPGDYLKLIKGGLWEEA